MRTDIPLVLLLGIFSTVQTHLAKALGRQGIEVFEQIKARLSGNAARLLGALVSRRRCWLQRIMIVLSSGS